MNDDSRVDLSALDLRSDPEHWTAFRDNTLARVDQLLALRSPDPLTLIATWTKALTVGAIVVLFTLLPVEIVLEKREARAEQVQRLVHLSWETIRSDQQPTGAELFQALGDRARP